MHIKEGKRHQESPTTMEEKVIFMLQLDICTIKNEKSAALSSLWHHHKRGTYFAAFTKSLFNYTKRQHLLDHYPGTLTAYFLQSAAPTTRKLNLWMSHLENGCGCLWLISKLAAGLLWVHRLWIKFNRLILTKVIFSTCSRETFSLVWNPAAEGRAWFQISASSGFWVSFCSQSAQRRTCNN